MKECDPFNFDTIRCICSHKSSPMCNLILIERLHVLLIYKIFYSQSVCKMKIIFFAILVMLLKLFMHATNNDYRS